MVFGHEVALTWGWSWSQQARDSAAILGLMDTDAAIAIFGGQSQIRQWLEAVNFKQRSVHSDCERMQNKIVLFIEIARRLKWLENTNPNVVEATKHAHR